MAQPPSSQSSGAVPAAAPHLTRGFLFADLRDYAGFVETHGDRAGAALLARYRSLVRGVVAAAAGADGAPVGTPAPIVTTICCL